MKRDIRSGLKVVEAASSSKHRSHSSSFSQINSSISTGKDRPIVTRAAQLSQTQLVDTQRGSEIYCTIEIACFLPRPAIMFRAFRDFTTLALHTLR